MNNNQLEVPARINLGTVSGDTQGGDGIYWEGFDHEFKGGISED